MEPRDACPACDHKLHPQEMEGLYRGRKLDCWHCATRLKARSRLNLQWLAQMLIAFWGLFESVLGLDGPGSGLWSLAIAGVIILALQLLPPGVVVGAPWVRIVATEDGPAAPGDESGPDNESG